MKKILTLVLAMMLLLGCTVTAAQADDVIELNLQTLVGDQFYLDKAIEVYNAKFPQYKVVPTYTVKTEYVDRVLTMFAGKAEFDLVQMNGLTYVMDYAAKGAVLDLTDIIAESGLDVSPYGALYQQLVETMGGRSYGLPYRGGGWVLYYNKDLFDKEGIPYPGQLTWNEYAELALRFTKDEGADKQWGGYWYPDPQGLHPALQQGATILDDDLSAVRSSLEFVNKLYNVDKSMMSIQEKTATQSYFITEFEKGNIAMFPNGDWCVSLLMRDAEAGKHNVNWGIAPYPVPDGVAPGTSVGSACLFGIPSTSKKVDAAFHFLSWLCSEEGQTIIARNGILTGMINDGIKQAFVEGSGNPETATFFEQSYVSGTPLDPKYPELQTIWQEEENLYLLGEQDLDTTMNNYMERREMVLLDD